MTATSRAVGPQANVGPTAPTATPARHGATVGASGAGGELDSHERVSEAHTRLAALHFEIAGIHQELAIELAAGVDSALMERVPEASKTRRLLTVNGLAGLLQVDRKTVRAWRERGQLPTAVKIGGVIRWDADDIDRWIEEQREAVR